MVLSLMNRFTIRKKLNIIFIIAVGVVVVTSLLAMYGLSNRYNKELYEKSSINNKYISNNIKSEIGTVCAISDSILTDSIYLSNLAILNNKYASKIEQTMASITIQKRAMSAMTSNDNITAITFDIHDYIVTTGGQLNLTEKEKEVAITCAKERSGQIAYITYPEKTTYLYIVRQLYSYQYGELGTVFIKVNLSNIVENVSGDYEAVTLAQQYILINEKKEVIYPKNFQYEEECIPLLRAKEGYVIKTIDHKKMFVAMNNIEELDWHCVSLTDYAEIFGVIRATRNKSIALLLFVVIGISFFINRLSREISEHFTRLINKMKSFQTGNLNPLDVGVDYSLRSDEIGDIHQRFDEMVVKFNELITDNYKKQIVLKDTKIRMLEQQIDPHFLYNTLDSINLLAACNGQNEIATMARGLGNLFRFSIKENNETIPLYRELEILNNYIEIQKIRYQDRFYFINHIEKTCYEYEIPKMSLQPLVENAIKYSMENNDETCYIYLDLKTKGDIIYLSVSNTGSEFDLDYVNAMMEQNSMPQVGIGISNINTRIKLIYGDEYGIQLRNKDNMAIVTIKIPKWITGEYDDKNTNSG